jgi:hypothetical protein
MITNNIFTNCNPGALTGINGTGNSAAGNMRRIVVSCHLIVVIVVIFGIAISFVMILSLWQWSQFHQQNRPIGSAHENGAYDEGKRNRRKERPPLHQFKQHNGSGVKKTE